MGQQGRLTITILLLVVFASPAQTGVVKVEVKCPEKVLTGDQFQFQVHVMTDGSAVPLPEIPNFTNLTYAQDTSFERKGKLNNYRTEQFFYHALARSPGTIVLSGIRAGGAEANPVQVTVMDPKKAAAESNQKGPIFAQAETSSAEVWQGEQFVFDIHLFFQLSVQRCGANVDSALKDFYAKPVAIKPEGKKTLVKGEEYHRALVLRRIVTALEPGDFEIPPIRLTGQVKTGDRRNTFFARTEPFERVTRGPVLTQPIRIKVNALPKEGRPADFSKAVGKGFNISGRVSDREVAVGEPFTLSVDIRGAGNLDSISEPKKTFPAWVEIFDSERKVTQTFKQNSIVGNVHYDYVLIARQEGEIVLEPIEITYFDTSVKQYVTKKTTKFPLKVTPDEGRGEFYLARGNRKRIRVTGEDFRHIQTTGIRLSPDKNRPAITSGLFWGVTVGPWLVFAGLSVYRRRKDYLAKNPDAARRIHAKGAVREHLASAERMMKTEDDTFFGELESAVHELLSGATGLSTRGMTRQQLEETLSNPSEWKAVSRGRARPALNGEILKTLVGTLDDLDSMRFAKGNLGTEKRREVFEQVQRLVSQVRKT